MVEAVIDIGSNSVRLMRFVDGIAQKHVTTTRLGEGHIEGAELLIDPMERTLRAVESYVNITRANGDQPIYIFATEAVRSASNGEHFADMVYQRVGIKLDILTRDMEALSGFRGASEGEPSLVVDIGGASTEIAVGDSAGIKYAKSLPIGVVRLKDGSRHGVDIDKYIVDMVDTFGDIPLSENYYVIGGTAGTVVAIAEQMSVYDTSVTHGYTLTKKILAKVYDRVVSTPLYERDSIVGLPASRRDTIEFGIMVLQAVMRYLDIDSIKVSEKDNLEGYLSLKRN